MLGVGIGCCLQAEVDGMEDNMYLSTVFLFPSYVGKAVFFSIT